MSTITAPPTAAGKAPQLGAADQLIEQRIDEARKALWWAEFVREILRTLIVAVVAILAWVVVDQWVFSPGVSLRLLASVGLAIWCGWRLVTRILPLLGSSIRPEYAARSLERDLPEMKQQLTSYVTLRDGRELPGLRSRVVRSIGSHVAGRLRTHTALPAEAAGTFRWWIAVAAVLALFVGYAVLSPKNTLASVGRLVAPLAAIDSPKRVAITDVTPGDTDAIAGRKVKVTAKVDGLQDEESVWCRWTSDSGQQETELTFAAAEFRFVGELDLDHAAAGSIAYYIEAGDAQAGPFWLAVQNVPVVALQSVHYQPPEYTGELPYTSSSGAITAIDATQVTIRAKTNRAIERATIEFNPRLLGESVRATAGAKSMEIDPQGTGLAVSFPLRSARGRSSAVQLESYRIRVWDTAEQSNPDPIVYPIRVIADLPPEVSIVMPRQTPKNLPLGAQQIIEVHAMDPDFGLQQVALKIRRGIDVIAEPSLWSDPAGAKGNRVMEYRFRPTEHGLRVGDVVKIEAIAIDNRDVPEDPSIEANVTVTDAIELRMVDREPLPDQADGNDGLSAPDDRPASDDQGDQRSQSDANSDSTGTGDQQQSGGGKGDEGTSSSQSGNSGEGSETGQGSGSGDQNSKPDSGGESGNDSESSGSDSGSGSEGSGSKGTEATNPSDPGDPNAANDQPDNKTPAEGSKPSSSENPQGTNSPSGDSPTGESAGESATGESATGDANSQPQTDGNAGSAANSDGGQADSANDAPPKHDGEAFERIRDYLDKQQRQQDQTANDSDPGNNPQQQPDQQGDAADSQASQTGEPGSQQQQPNGAESERSPDSGSKPENGSKPDQGPKPEQGTEGNPADQTSGDPSSPQQREPGQTQGSETEPSGNRPQDSGTEDSGNAGDESSDPQTDAEGGAESESNAGTDSAGKSPDTGKTGEPGQKTDSSQTDGSKPDDQAAGETPGSDPQQGQQPSDAAQSPDAGTPESGSDNAGSEAGNKPGSEAGNKPGSEAGQPSENGSANDQGDSRPPDPNDQDPNDQPRENSQADPSGNNKPANSSAAGDQAAQDANQQQPTSGDPASSSSAPPQGTPTQASGDGTSSGEAGQPAPAPPDLEYTKQATDMVLDYLKETRDKPDTDLLKDLNWTEQDLQRFADRWQKVRDLEQSAPADAETSASVEEALRSLGMRPPSSDAALENADQADTLRGIRDAGNRKPPPAAYRDVFEAFRRAVGRQ